MTYRAYIKKDYKPQIRWVPDEPWYLRNIRVWLSLVTVPILLGAYVLYPGIETAPAPIEMPIHIANVADVVTDYTPDVLDEPEQFEAGVETDSTPQQPPVLPWQTVKIKKGDNLSIIFDRLGLAPNLLFQIVNASDDTRILKELMPGQKLDFLIQEGEFLALRFEPDLTTTLDVIKNEQGISGKTTVTELELRSNESRGSINSSLFLAGQRAGLSDRLIMELVAIFGWDIDFALDIRSGDEFRVIYQEQFKDNVKVGEGPILAAEFINQNRVYRTVRYTSIEGDTNYFNEDGVSMRKAFLRTPLNFSRISSHFNLRRKHPVLNRIRAHKGVDYAAPTGTPIKATGDGTVTLAANKGGYGKTVILKHGSARSTLYAHMSAFARNVKKGKRVKQGQIIGYVGKSGLATGPHLHYEFQVNGVHRNPLTVTLPKASGVPAERISHFKQQTAMLLDQLGKNETARLAGNTSDTVSEESFAALDDSILPGNRVH